MTYQSHNQLDSPRIIIIVLEVYMLKPKVSSSPFSGGSLFSSLSICVPSIEIGVWFQHNEGRWLSSPLLINFSYWCVGNIVKWSRTSSFPLQYRVSINADFYITSMCQRDT